MPIFLEVYKRVLDWSTIEVDLRRAFRDVTSPPQGVALVEFPTNILYRDGLVSDQRLGAKLYAPGELRSGADPQSIERAIEILLAAKRPLIAAGDGVFWSGAAAELREFVELTKVPVYARRTGQGAVRGGPPACDPGSMEKAVHWARRRGTGDRLSVLERREIRRGTHMESIRTLHSGRRYANAHRPPCAGGSRNGR